MASLGQDIPPDEMRRFKYYHLVMHWGRMVLFLIYHKSFLDGQSKTICEILVANGVSLGKRGPLKAYEIKTLKERPPEDLDISVLYRVCKCLWQKGIKDPGYKLRQMVQWIKNERNYVSHEEINIPEESFSTKVNEFQNLLMDTLLEAKFVFPHYGMEIDQLLADIKVEVPMLLEYSCEHYNPQNPGDKLKRQQDIKVFWDKLVKHILQLSQEELKSNKDLCKIRAFDWLVQDQATDPSDFIVNLEMGQEKEFHGDSNISRCTSVKEREILIIKDRNGKEPKAVLISGDAGSGKTTLLSSIVKKYQTDSGAIADLSSYQILLYMEFRNHSLSNFGKFLQNCLPKVTSAYDLRFVIASMRSAKCLILCDGFDEANPQSLNLFKEMLYLKFKEMKIVVTTRPNSTDRLTNIVDNARCQRINLSILGLNLQDMEALTEKITNHLLPDDMTRKDKMHRELSQAINNVDESVMASLKTPLYFNLYNLLYIECPDSRNEMRSVTQLYIHLKKHMFKRIIDKTGVDVRSLDEFEKLLRDWSLPNYINKKYELSESDVDELKSKIQCQEILQHFDSIMSCYFNVKHKLNNLVVEKVFCYRHRSEQEFTVAKIICEDIIKEVKNKKKNVFGSVLSSIGVLQSEANELPEEMCNIFQVNKEYKKNERLKDLLPFIVGILYSTNRDVFFNVLSDIHNYVLSIGKRGVNLDIVLIPLSETNFDLRVLDSLVSALKSFPGKCMYRLKSIKSFFPINLLLPRLSPRHVERIHIEVHQINLSILTQTIRMANKYNIPVNVFFDIDLKDLPNPSDQALDGSVPASCNVDLLCITIQDEEGVDLSTLYQIPISWVNLKVIVLHHDRNIRDFPQMLNAIWPRPLSSRPQPRRMKIDDTKGKSPRKLKKRAKEPQGTYQKLWIQDFGEKCIEYKDKDIRFVIKSLNIMPLTELHIVGQSGCRKGIKDAESLHELCKTKGLGSLNIMDPAERALELMANGKFDLSRLAEGLQ